MNPFALVGIVLAMVVFGGAGMDQLARNNPVGGGVLLLIGAGMIFSFILMGGGFEKSK
ncbi:hypothetical protein [Mesorhizobium sp. SP-1A]|uniref:hypothetical protein n=1 Tax=Mesorhizobium sp. SP-1A TaxID=3077840 RepID=UPI0028F702D1|nr:hypothetical protein [Mesorhizobium sp. SP-1A]